MSKFPNDPSSALPPHIAPMPRTRAEIIEDLRHMYDAVENQRAVQLPVTEFEVRQTWRLMIELLLDIRDLQAECAWRLSDAEGAERPFTYRDRR